MKYRETINAMNEVNRMIEYHSLVWPVASLVGTFMYDIVNEIELTDMSIRNERLKWFGRGPFAFGMMMGLFVCLCVYMCLN